MSRFPRRRQTALLGLLAVALVGFGLLLAHGLGSDGETVRTQRARALGPTTTGTLPPQAPIAPTSGTTTTPRPAPAPDPGADTPPNIVYVLTDDLTADLLRYMPSVGRLQAEGTQFSRFVVANSLCCPSRAATFTGRYPHSTGVKTNTYPDGGWYAFEERGLERSTYATDLQKAGYRTGLMGKYLNEYEVGSTRPPPGWDEWAVTNKGYHNVNYTLNVNGRTVRFGGGEQDYLTDVLTRRARKVLTQSRRDGRPFFLELSTFAPHGPATPARRDRGTLAGVQAPRYGSWDQEVENGPSWLAGRPPLSPSDIADIDKRFELRAESVKAVDRMITQVRFQLQRLGMAENTYVVFNSDNGLHLGQRRLMPGKMTAFDEDIRVPLVVAGPGVPAGQTVDALAQNIDLRPTFDEWAGAPVKPVVEGASLAGFLRGEPPAAWRAAALVEHKGPDLDPSDPDYQATPGGDPTSYKALRLPDATYVESDNGEREYYDLKTDPDQLHNTWGSLPPEQQADLAARVARMGTCRGAACSAPG